MGLSLIYLNFNSRFSIYFILTCTRPVDIKHGQIITSIRCSTVLFSAFRVLKDFEDFFSKIRLPKFQDICPTLIKFTEERRKESAVWD